MPRYFFHVINGNFVPDNEGTECATPDDVKAQAIKAAGAMIEEQGVLMWKTRHWDMFVCDEQNRTHLKLSFSAEDMTGELS